MQRIAESFASTMPDWIRTSFFDPEMEKQRLSTHMYQQSDDISTLRSLDNLHLIDFIELTLKGNDGFETAMNNLLKSNLADYMKKVSCTFTRRLACTVFYVQSYLQETCRY